MNQNEEFILMILNCKKYRHKALDQKNSWLNSLQKICPIQYYHIIGDPAINVEYVFDDEEKILYVNAKDDYISLPQKVIIAQKALYERFHFNYLFKTDDDQTLVDITIIPKLIHMLKSSSKIKTHYGGQFVNIKHDMYSTYSTYHPELSKNLMKKCIYATGRFYFLSAEAVADLLTKQSYFLQEQIEDYSVGYYLSPKYKVNAFNFNSSNYFYG